MLGERGKPDEKMFAGLYSPGSTNRCLENWCHRAGIDKKITFHCARHTFQYLKELALTNCISMMFQNIGFGN